MNNEVQKVSYIQAKGVAQEQERKMRGQERTAASPLFKGLDSAIADGIEMSRPLELSKEDRLKVIERLEQNIQNLSDQFSNVKAHQGWVGKSWDFLKNLTGIGAGSNKAQSAVSELKAKIATLKSNPDKLEEVFKEITGKSLTASNLQKLDSGELQFKGQEKVAKYEQGQGMAKGLVSTILTIGAVTGIMAAGIVTTPFTGGASLAGSLAACAAILGTGAAVSVAVNSSDALTSEAKDYSFKQAGKDAVSGAVDGALTVATAGIGNAVVKGTQVAAKATRFGQVLVKPTVQHTLTGVATGAAFGGGGAATDYALNSEEFKISEFLKVTGKGGTSGAVFGGVAGAMGAKMATVNSKVADSVANVENKFLSKTITGTTKAATTAATGFVGGGASSELEYLMSADDVTLDGAIDAFTTGGQGGSAMMLGFEAVNKGIMKLPKKTQPLKPNERQVFEVERDDYIENEAWLVEPAKPEIKKEAGKSKSKAKNSKLQPLQNIINSARELDATARQAAEKADLAISLNEETAHKEISPTTEPVNPKASIDTLYNEKNSSKIEERITEKTSKLAKLPEIQGFDECKKHILELSIGGEEGINGGHIAELYDDMLHRFNLLRNAELDGRNNYKYLNNVIMEHTKGAYTVAHKCQFVENGLKIELYPTAQNSAKIIGLIDKSGNIEFFNSDGSNSQLPNIEANQVALKNYKRQSQRFSQRIMESYNMDNLPINPRCYSDDSGCIIEYDTNTFAGHTQHTQIKLIKIDDTYPPFFAKYVNGVSVSPKTFIPKAQLLEAFDFVKRTKDLKAYKHTDINYYIKYKNVFYSMCFDTNNPNRLITLFPIHEQALLDRKIALTNIPIYNE